jgi:nitrate/nitrite transporter NarK
MSVRPRLAGSAAGITGAMTLAGGSAMATATGFVLAGDPSAEGLLLLLLATCTAGLLVVLAAMVLERRTAARATA